MYTAAAGMKAQQLYVDNISNNLANVNTTGFKKGKVEFQDLLYQTLREPGAQTSDGTKLPSGLQIGLGVKSAANQRIFSQGNMIETKNPLDLALEGEGFIQVLRPDGSIAYTRDGSLKISSEGVLVTSEGFPIEPEIMIPEGAKNLGISSTGSVSATLEGEEFPQEIGQVELARFVNSAGLRSMGGNLYEVTIASGDAVVGMPGTETFGTLHQGYLESSNVEVVEEMVGMITAQRAYEITSKAIQTSEEMLQIANQLKR
jgi:flagellar basal-body rod protein FlgG